MVREPDLFLDIVDRDIAEHRRWIVIRPGVLEVERVPLEEVPGRFLAGEVVAKIDVPGFDRSNVAGFAVRAEVTFGAAEESPRGRQLNPEEIATGVVPWSMIAPVTATAIATGGMASAYLRSIWLILATPRPSEAPRPGKVERCQTRLRHHRCKSRHIKE